MANSSPTDPTRVLSTLIEVVERRGFTIVAATVLLAYLVWVNLTVLTTVQTNMQAAQRIDQEVAIEMRQQTTLMRQMTDDLRALRQASNYWPRAVP